jgi:hypothetical protein
MHFPLKAIDKYVVLKNVLLKSVYEEIFFILIPEKASLGSIAIM